MRPARQPGAARQLIGGIQEARLRLLKAEGRLESAKEQARIAKQRRKEAKEAARLAKRQVRLAKKGFAEAKDLLFSAEQRFASAVERALRKQKLARSRRQSRPVVRGRQAGRGSVMPLKSKRKRHSSL